MLEIEKQVLGRGWILRNFFSNGIGYREHFDLRGVTVTSSMTQKNNAVMELKKLRFIKCKEGD
jgi:hypothetical protein